MANMLLLWTNCQQGTRHSQRGRSCKLQRQSAIMMQGGNLWRLWQSGNS